MGGIALFCYCVVTLVVACCAKMSVHKVVVPSVHKEWLRGVPGWVTDTALQNKYDYSVFLYQKLNSSAPNYIATNRGTEGAVYLRYIVDHYDNFPDIAVFVHAVPHKHQPRWLELLNCIHPNASYFNFNSEYICRDTGTWAPDLEIWVEQCWRNVLSIVWDLVGKPELLNLRVPVNKRIKMCAVASQQFLISRAMVHRRPLTVWKQLLKIIGEQPVCHEGDPDYKNLFSTSELSKNNKPLPGPETPNLPLAGESDAKPGFGRHTQGGAMEHLAHVVFGHQELESPKPSNADYCKHFMKSCPQSLCT